MAVPALDPVDVRVAVETALAEDIGRGDITTEAVIPADAVLNVHMVARQDLVVACLPVAVTVFDRLAPSASRDVTAAEGASVSPGTVIMRLQGPARGLLSAERTALNLVQLLSGIATRTRTFVERIAGTGAVVLDTRKTIPGLRALSKYATALGGAQNHRMRLDDGVLIKDNHIAVCGGVTQAVTRARDAGLTDIEVECDTLDQVREALAAGTNRILLDNMPPDILREAVRVNAGQVPLEASGGVSLDTIRAIAETGVDYISVGSITQSAPAVDIGLDLAEG